MGRIKNKYLYCFWIAILGTMIFTQIYLFSGIILDGGEALFGDDSLVILWIELILAIIAIPLTIKFISWERIK